MRLNILFGGKAGQGIDKVSSLTAGALSNLGYYTFSYRDYGSLIEGGHNFNVLSISDGPVASHESKFDGILSLDETTLEKHGDQLKEGGFVFQGDDFENAKDFGRSYNMLFAGALIRTLGINFKKLEEVIREEFQKEKVVEKNIQAARKGYDSAEEERQLDEVGDKLELMNGSEAVGKGAIESGIDVYLGYPMTPMTPVLHYLAARQRDENFLVFQPENELSVANAALGAAHTGAKTMIGSSGGGYDLMQEAMSMQGVSEIPLVVYLAQRAGTGTGIPTYTEQGDLEVATKGSHAEFPRITIAPGDPTEAIEAANQAFYFAEKYRLLSVILSDKHLAESEFTILKEPEIQKVKRNIDTQKKDGLYKNYRYVEDGISPRSVPGLNVVKSSSYEHDEKGITIEDKDIAKRMVDKRLKKQEKVVEESKKFEQSKIHGDEDADKVVVGWGSTKGAILDATRGKNVKFLQILYLEPFPEEIGKILEDADKVILVENNSTGLLGNLIREKTGYKIKDKNKILKYDGRPFKSDELGNKIKEMI